MRFGVLFVLLSLFAISSSAFVYGTIYNGNLEQANKTILRIDGAFTYQMVTDRANYSIFLPNGEYKLSGQSMDKEGNLAFYAENTIHVGDADQQVDVVLKPVGVNPLVLISSAIILVAVIFWFVIRKKKNFEASENVDVPVRAPEPIKSIKLELDEDSKSVLKILDSFESRATQKELKETLKFSDAKLSLILTELEHTGHVKKFRRGRTNVIRKI